MMRSGIVQTVNTNIHGSGKYKYAGICPAAGNALQEMVFVGNGTFNIITGWNLCTSHADRKRSGDNRYAR